ncbi:MAG: hypothetical protein LBS56_07605 [Propionibacteriaceae bacterium]|jgi:predicted transcriptional regulator of viral defense system|nr:hypothetical protein [Propionibacteriaceae bacterium]
MAIQEYLSANQVFSADDFRHAFPGSRTDVNLLSRAVAAGRVGRPKRGLYVSKVGPFSRSQADPFDVASKAAADAVFCLLSALQLHGVLHNVTFRTQFYTSHKIAPFTYEGQDYRPVASPTPPPATQGLLTPSGRHHQVTTREQTLVDCLARLSLAGGPENALRSLAGLRHIDAAAAVSLARHASATTRARLGWVLQAKADEWRVPAETLDALAWTLGGGPHYFAPADEPDEPDWVNRWRLYLPRPEQEMAAWLNQ